MEQHLYLTAFFAGTLLHVFIFSKNEWDRRSPWISLFLCSLLAIIGLILNMGYQYHLLAALLRACVLEGVLLGGLVSSMTVYRLYLHPLRSFPGPFGARLTAFWFTKESIPDLRFYVKLRTYHDQYGDFVRIRPRELSIRHPDAIVDVHGPKNKIKKGEFYEQNDPFMSLQMSRDVDFHKHQRKFWDRAFHNKALTEYSPLLTKHYRIFLNILLNQAETEDHVDASNVLMDLFFDIVSDLTFGKSFNALTEKRRNPIIGEFLKQQKAVGFLLQHMPLFYLIRCLPFVQERVNAWIGFYNNALDEREKMTSMSADFYTYLSQSEHFKAHGNQEAQLAIIAGADTNAITISNACYLLCRHPNYQEALYQELRDLPTASGIIDDEHLVGISLLSAIIHEVLRLHPPVPGGLQRVTPPPGVTVAGRYIPGNMVISTPTYSIQRDPRAFPQPDDFIPERWSTRPELILRRDAFVAFGYGPYNCAGKPLAMLQLRMVLAMIIQNFEISVPPGREKEFHQFADEQSDCFTIHLSPLLLRLKRRIR
ncbi:cytochrome P450 [Paraphoma chrysanthemicola]|uniref:Cytochrome P450 n=1 Tax=Paraphoma chrysanthemicola TaxID=798071 RepID=A0A8K0QWJ8_9PLEO|nr:cytochrome P450 [Paraphoma chrysanthemicola]